ncbi:hypothetical protein PCIT_b0828 [Pseudoalteromonas citrea]|uniref:Response regulatory domain-containing protein n=2 Tax=Pseudoalteromonas citrea TaxID=43655 RepID=A0AAD4FQ88_9GAMM|nr:response regulator [Pseudoalteromonas citrea]KAF7764764.1 hypothetical protein PCIT_b0828 [Pseudoalteromonas citrea]
MRILVVDDMASMRHVMINMLRHVGFDDIDEAVDGYQAMVLLKSRPYDLVISDLNMPKIDGLQLLQAIRQDRILAKTPLLMVTGENEKEKVQQALLAKVSGFVIKPFNMNTLEKQLTRLHLLD